MKKTTILLLLIFVSRFISSGQIMIGPKIGGTLNYVSFAEDESKEDFESSPHFGYQGGLVLNFVMSENFSLQTELNYTRKGKKVDVGSQGISHVANYNYLEVPLLFRFSTEFKDEGIGKYEGYVNIGPNFNYWINGNGNYSGGGLEEFGIEEQKYKLTYESTADQLFVDIINIRDARRFQVGIDFGLGFVFHTLPSQKIMLDFRYHWGHTNLAQTNSYQTNSLYFLDDVRSANRSFSVSVAYLLEVDFLAGNKGGSTSGGGKNKEKVGRKTNVPGGRKKNKF